jgi:cell division protein FtsB
MMQPDTRARRPSRGKAAEFMPSSSSTRLEVVDDRPMWSRLTTRAVVLLLVLAALVMALAFPLREYIAQRAEIGALQRQLDEHKDGVTALEAKQENWRDPKFVEEQARERLHYVFPGEKGVVLLSQDDMKDAREPEVRVAVEPEVAWYDTLWGSVQAADDPK